jgi:hypothetical protein
MEVVFAYEAWSRLADVSNAQTLRDLADLLVVVNVTLRVGVGLLGSLEGNANEVLSKDVVENAGTQVAVLLELWHRLAYHQNTRRRIEAIPSR